MYTEINPIDKVEDLKRLLSVQHFEIKSASDEGYDWLEENSVCIAVYNSTCEKTLEILQEIYICSIIHIFIKSNLYNFISIQSYP